MPTFRYRNWKKYSYIAGGRHGCYPHNGIGRLGQLFLGTFTLPTGQVFARLLTGKEKDDFFFTTDLTMKPAEEISYFAGRA